MNIFHYLNITTIRIHQNIFTLDHRFRNSIFAKDLRKKLFSWFLSFLFIIFTGLNVLAQDYFFGTPLIKNFSTEEFKGGIQSWGITQDSGEILYFANNFGLLEFDGTNWNLFPINNGTKVRSVLVAGDDRIYVGSQADFGYFEPNETGTLRYYSLADSLPEAFQNFDEVWRIYEIDKKVYFLTFKNIYVYSSGKPVEVITADSPLEFSFKVNNNLYSLVWNHGLCILDNNRLKIIPGGDFFANLQIASILPFDKNNLLIFTIKNGLFLYDGLSVLPFAQKNQTLLNSLIINQAIVLSDGSFAIGTQNKGLLIIDREGNSLLHLSRDKGLYDQTIHTLYQDSHENLWLGLNSGLSMVELSSPFSLIDGTMGLAGTGYAALQKDKQLYLGTNNGLYTMDLTNPERYLKLVPNSTGQVYHLSNIDNKLLMGHHNGPFEINDGKAIAIYDEKGAWEFKSVPNSPGKVIMGSYNGISLLSTENEEVKLIEKFDNFDESSRVLEFDEHGELWMAHGYKGIFKIAFDEAFQVIKQIKFYNSNKGFPSDHLINMEKVNNKLIFPAQFGIFVYNDSSDRFAKDELLSSLFGENEHIVKMEEDILGNVFFVSNQRVGRLSFDKFGTGSIESRVFNKIRDLLNDDLGTIQILDAKNILFGAKTGFIHYNTEKEKRMQSFFTHIKRVINTSREVDSLMLEGKGVLRSSMAPLEYHLNSLRFVYSASFFESPENTEYQFFLKNFDNGWSEWTNKVEKEYTNLPEGDYEFHVRARNVYGTLSEADAFNFTVHPPFYRSKLAYFIYSLSGFFLIGLTFYHFDKKLTREKKQMMIQQEHELNQKNDQIEQITSQSEQEIIKLRNEKLRSEIDHMNKELTSSTIHLINKNELLNNVKLGLSEILRRKEKSSFNDELKRIIKNIDHNITSDADWKHFELHFNHVHGNFTNRLLEKYPKLSPQEIKLSAYLRLNLTTKEIAHLLNISVRGVEISRYRLRKKLMLDRNDNLTDFMLKF